MPRHFQVGEVAVIDAKTKHRQYAGRTCTVVEPLRERTVTTPNGVRSVSVCYVVQFDDGAIATACARSLAKYFEPGSWKVLEGIWRPAGRRKFDA